MLSDGTYILERDGIDSSSQEALYRYFSTRRVTLEEPSPVLPEAADNPIAEESAPVKKDETVGWFRRLFSSRS